MPVQHVRASGADLESLYAEAQAAIFVMNQSGGMDPEARAVMQRVRDEAVAQIDANPIADCERDFLFAARTAFYFLGRVVDRMEEFEDAVRRNDTTVIDHLGAELPGMIAVAVNLLNQLPYLYAEVDC